MKTACTTLTLLALLATGARAAEEPARTIDQVLERRVTMEFKSQSLSAALQDLARQVQAGLPRGSTVKVDIQLLGRDLQLEGITRNQQIRDFKQRNQRFRTVLTALLQRANVTKVGDPTDPRQILVWLVGPDPDDAKQHRILITTRRAAAKRSYQLADEFVKKTVKP